ncbi:MAG TPA: helicase-associated domain-containing protein [Ktedonobacterales bacterium]|jgi:hypothetical protein
MSASHPSPVAPGLAEATRLQRDLYLYWSGVARAGGVGLTGRGYVARPALRRLRDDLATGAPTSPAGAPADGDAAEAEQPRLFFIRRALERLGLLRISGGAGEPQRLEAADARAMGRYLARSLAERSQALLRLWVGAGWWPDRLDPRAEAPGLLAPAPPRVAVARRRLLEDIAALDQGAIIPAPGAARPIRALASHGRAARRRTPTHPPARSLTSLALVGDEAAASALAGPLTWLGVVVWDDVAGEWRAGLPGAALHGDERGEGHGDERDSAALVETHGRVVAQSDLSIIAYAPFSAPELLTLDLCASREALSQTARYRVTRAAFSGARDFGWDAAEVARRLERLIGAPPPRALRVKLSDWERLASRLRLEDGVTLLETPTPETLDALLADRASAGWGIRRVTPTAAAIAPEAAPRARAWLLRHGCLPALREE